LMGGGALIGDTQSDQHLLVIVTVIVHLAGCSLSDLQPPNTGRRCKDASR